jgi:TonB family protein
VRAVRAWLSALLIASILAPFAFGIASADCATDLRTHLSTAIAAYKEWVARNKPVNSYGDAQWGHFEDELNWVRDQGNMPDCNDDAFETPYYLYSARADRFVVMADARRPGPGVRFGPVRPSDYNYALNMRLDRYYSDVGMLYSFGYARENPGEYAAFKQDVMHWFARLHRHFTSWESTKAHSPLPSEAAHRACVMRDRPPIVVNPIQPEYPQLERAVAMGSVTVTVRVVISPTGQVTKATVLQSSTNALIDGAAIQAARESTYTPAIKDCKPVTGSYVFRADLSL